MSIIGWNFGTQMYCSMCINASSLPNWTCEMRKMQFIFFVPPNEELKGTLHPQKFGCTPKNEGKRVHVPLNEKTCGNAAEEHQFRSGN